MSYAPTTTSDLLADIISEAYTTDLDDLHETGVGVTRDRLVTLLDAIHGDLDAYDKLPREWQELTH